ncbi:MAG: DNA-3-methyladenine glycosylase 2 family protein [bacterium]
MSKPPNLKTLTKETYYRGISRLGMQDSDLANVVLRWGNPPFWTHAPGFPGIVVAILAQQVSLESARAAFTKLEGAIGSVNPEEFLSLEDDILRAIGFSRQKASYVRGLAHGIRAGDIDLAALESMDNKDARMSLMELRGIGAWTADTYLLFSLRRADAWPSGDLALAKAIQELRGLATTPGTEKVDRIADHWKPWRAVAARILWHHYLCERGRTTSA